MHDPPSLLADWPSVAVSPPVLMAPLDLRVAEVLCPKAVRASQHGSTPRQRLVLQQIFPSGCPAPSNFSPWLSLTRFDKNVASKPRRLPPGFFAWWWQVYFAPEEEIMMVSGLDMAVYIRILTFCKCGIDELFIRTADIQRRKCPSL